MAVRSLRYPAIMPRTYSLPVSRSDSEGCPASPSSHSSLALPAPPAAASPSSNGAKKVTAVLFEWSFDSIARERTRTLGPKGYGFVRWGGATGQPPDRTPARRRLGETALVHQA